jgi:very-short-patch-repair endonuclease
MNQDKHFQLLQQRAAGMRENLTSTERKLLEALEITKGLPKFYPQHVIYPHIVDFVCLEKMIIIEVDGASHDGNQASDDLRDHDLQKLGYTVMRFTNGEVALSLATVVDSIKFECSFRTTKQMSSPKSVVKN